MTTLAHRATPSQRRILRAVIGAVKNTSDAHPEYKITPTLARSIAKRAAGTLTAQWPEVLAARLVPSDRADGDRTCISRPQSLSPLKRAGRGPQSLGMRSPLRRLWKEMSIAVGEAKRAGQTERAEALIFALKRIAALQRADQW